MTQIHLPFNLPPVDVVRELAEILEPGVPRTVFDAGCGSGRNAVFLASLGHEVIGVDMSATELEAARRHAEAEQVADRCTFIEGDLLNFPFSNTPFDIVLANEVSQMFSQTVTRRLFDMLRGATKQGGLNVISGYVVRPGTANAKNTRQCLGEGELLADYEKRGWIILSSDEMYRPNQYVGSGAAIKEIISSRAKVIAQRPWDEDVD